MANMGSVYPDVLCSQMCCILCFFSLLKCVAPSIAPVALQAFSALLRSHGDFVVVESYSIDVDMNKKSISKALTDMAERDFKARITS